MNKKIKRITPELVEEMQHNHPLWEWQEVVNAVSSTKINEIIEAVNKLSKEK